MTFNFTNHFEAVLTRNRIGLRAMVGGRRLRAFDLSLAIGSHSAEPTTDPSAKPAEATTEPKAADPAFFMD
jgi:hypothetical protein